MRPIVWITLLALSVPVTAVTLRADDKADGEVARLVQALGADDFRTREAASHKLAAHGAAAREALQKAVSTSKSPEVRWRAEQLLRQLDGTKPRPLGGGAGGRPGTTETPQGESKDPFARLRQWMDRFSKRMDSDFAAPFGPLTAPRRLSVPGLLLERGTSGSVTLRVKRKNEAGAQIEDAYEGTSLKDILRRNPELEGHPGLAELKRRDAEQSWPGFENWIRRKIPQMQVVPGERATTFSLSTSQGVSITHDADGVTVRLTEKNDEGEPKVREFKGESIEAIKKAHPELADKFGGISIQFRGPNFIWPGRNNQGLRLLPRPPTTPGTAPEKPSEAPFGLTLTTPDEVLAVHLGLTKEMGALVVRVHPGSQAAQMGLERNDIIVRVNDTPVNLESAVATIRAAGKSKGALALELIRRGDKVTLRR